MNVSKKIISYPPDVTVVVGSGENKQEFQCYGAILAAASPVLDAMLSSGMMESESRLINFPDKDPTNWSLFLECIDNAKAFLAYDESVGDYFDASDDALLNESNVRTVVPLFHELQMDEYLKKCDTILRKTNKSKFYWPSIKKESDGSKQANLELFAFATKYHLRKTQENAENSIARGLEHVLWGVGHPDRFDVTTVEGLINIFRPFKLVEKELVQVAKKQRCNGMIKGIYEASNCKNLWAQISSCIEDDLSILSLQEVNEGNAFSRIVYYAVQRYHKSMRLEVEQICEKFRKRCVLAIKNESLKKSIRESLITVKDDVHRLIARAAGDLIPFDAGSGNFSRSFQLSTSSSQKVSYIQMIFDPSLSVNNVNAVHYKYENSVRDCSTTSKTTNKQRFCEEDLTVVIGCEGDAQEFRCNGALLSFASAKLDTTISEASGCLRLPSFDPTKWKLFYNCIDPCHNGSFLNEENVQSLTPWFAEFEMSNYLEASKCILVSVIDDLEYKCPIHNIINLLKLSVAHDFKDVQNEAELHVEEMFEEYGGDLLLDAMFGFDLQATKDLVSLCLPLQRTTNVAQGPFLSTNGSIIWRSISSFIGTQLASLSFNRVDFSECEMFSNLVFHLLSHEAYRRASEQDN